MRQQAVAIEKSFIKGRLSEYTGLNFPENACTDESNCIFERTGLVTRREGIDFEVNASTRSIDSNNKAVSKFYWRNVAGDGTVNILVNQIGSTLYFYDVSTPDKAACISQNLFANNINLTVFLPAGSTLPISEIECQYAYGFGYLFVFHPNLDSFYISFTAPGTFTATAITLQTRDLIGITEGVEDSLRPSVLTVEHNYNLINQGWTEGNPWSALSGSYVLASLGTKTFTVPAGLTVTLGQTVGIYQTLRGTAITTMSGILSAYAGTSMTIIVGNVNSTFSGGTYNNWTLIPNSTGYINTWLAAIGNYPSNSDVWWRYKNASNVFDPTTTIAQVSVGSGPAPKGHFILNEFDQQRGVLSALSGLPSSTIYSRPSTGVWFQGRVCYTGVHSQGLNNKIYFSQIVEKVPQFGRCFQKNDPTSQDLFDPLPDDGGVIIVKEAETIRKLIPMRTALLVFASNGVWAVTGSQGIGFTATDNTIQKLDSIPSLSHTTFIDHNGTPVWWNNEGIYTIVIKNGDLKVESLTATTIATFFGDIPSLSKKFARGYYNRSSFIMQWLYRSTTAIGTTETYQFDSILNFNTITGAFYTWNISSSAHLTDIVVLSSDGDLTTANTVIEPTFKYLTTFNANQSLSFSEERDTSYYDFKSLDAVGTDFSSYYISGFKVHGDAQRKFQSNYIFLHSDATIPTQYKIQALWDYATSGNTGRWTSPQTGSINESDYQYVHRRYKLRGTGVACQIKIQSVSGQPFRIIGWSSFETGNPRG